MSTPMTDLDRAREVEALDRVRLAEIASLKAEIKAERWTEHGQSVVTQSAVLDIEAIRATARAEGFAEAREAAAGCAQSWLDMRPEQMRLLAGEMTAQEIRTAKAVAGGIVSAIRALSPAKSEG